MIGLFVSRLRDYSISRKIMIINLVTTIICMILVGCFISVEEYTDNRDQLIETIKAETEMVGHASSASILLGDQTGAFAKLMRLRFTQDFVYAALLKSDKSIFAEYAASGRYDDRFDAMLRTSSKGDQFSWDSRENQFQWSPGHVDVLHPIMVSDELVGFLFLRKSLANFHRRFALLGVIIFISVVVSLIISRQIIKRLQIAITRPIHGLLDVMRDLARDQNFSVRVEPYGRDELGSLAEGFNEMLVHIHKRDIEIADNRRHLEERIIQRTSQLAEANDRLSRELVERKLAEEKLKRYAEDLRQANEEIRNFTYIVSHDLRAPLVNIKGFSAELTFALKDLGACLGDMAAGVEGRKKPEIEKILSRDIPESLTFITSSVDRMDGLIGAILQLSRIGRRPFHPEPVDTGVMVDNILATIRHQLDRRRVTVNLGHLPGIVADRTDMEQIFGNLLDNATKYLDPNRNGSIEITAENYEHTCAFHVRDNGRGIAKEDIPKVFDLFRRVGVQDTPGEGMGLTYVAALIRRHGGRVWCDSELGVGTTFSFTIPQQSAAAAEPEAASVSSAADR